MREYAKVSDSSKIAWQHEEIPEFVRRAINRFQGKGKALDLGCGTGVHAAYMAAQGLDVTAIDFIPAAIGFAEDRAEKAGVSVDFHVADVTQWDNTTKFDLILDSGCLHNLGGKSRTLYKRKVLDWLAEDGALVLVHFGKRSLLDFNRVGLKIKRKTKHDIVSFLQPELQLKEFFAEEGERPLFFYLFARAAPAAG